MPPMSQTSSETSARSRRAAALAGRKFFPTLSTVAGISGPLSLRRKQHLRLLRLPRVGEHRHRARRLRGQFPAQPYRHLPSSVCCTWQF
jgi:hypothetical protein